MSRLVLIRHGAVDLRGIAYGQRVDPGLSVEGREEVVALGRRLRGGGNQRTQLGDQPPRLIVRSPTTRTRVTCELLGWQAEEVDARWSERDLGVWEGRPWAELWQEAPAAVSTDPASFAAFTPPDGEPLASLQQRVASVLEELGAEQAVEDPEAVAPIAVVCHGGPITCALAHVLGLEVVDALRLRIATATATWLTRWPGGSWTVDGVAT